MAFGTARLLARTLRDVTSVRGEDLREERFFPEGTPPQKPALPAPAAKAQVVCVASGKGGTGKSVVTTNLAALLAREDIRVTIIDADMGLANAHMLMGVMPEHDVSAVISGAKRMPEIAVECEGGVRLVSGGSGLAELAELPYGKLRHLASEIGLLEEEGGVILVDLAAGIGPQVLRFLFAAHSILLVTTPDATALLDAYATIKSIAALGISTPVRMLVNRAGDRQEAIEAYKKVAAVASRHDVRAALSFYGWVPRHRFVQDSVSMRRPVALAHPKSFVAAQLRAVAASLAGEHRGWLARQAVVPISAADVCDLPAAPFSVRLAEAASII